MGLQGRLSCLGTNSSVTQRGSPVTWVSSNLVGCRFLGVGGGLYLAPSNPSPKYLGPRREGKGKVGQTQGSSHPSKRWGGLQSLVALGDITEEALRSL